MIRNYMLQMNFVSNRRTLCNGSTKYHSIKAIARNQYLTFVTRNPRNRFSLSSCISKLTSGREDKENEIIFLSFPKEWGKQDKKLVV